MGIYLSNKISTTFKSNCVTKRPVGNIHKVVSDFILQWEKKHPIFGKMMMDLKEFIFLNLDFLNTAPRILTLKLKIGWMYVSEVKYTLICFDFLKIKANKYTHVTFYLFNNSHQGLVNLENQTFTHFFWVVSFSLCHKRAYITVQVHITSSRKNSYKTWQCFMFQLRHLCTQLTFRTPWYHYFISLCILSFHII